MRHYLSTLLLVVVATLLVGAAAIIFSGCKTTKCGGCNTYDGTSKHK